jgi:hypothetical protein
MRRSGWTKIRSSRAQISFRNKFPAAVISCRVFSKAAATSQVKRKKAQWNAPGWHSLNVRTRRASRPLISSWPRMRTLTSPITAPAAIAAGIGSYADVLPLSVSGRVAATFGRHRKRAVVSGEKGPARGWGHVVSERNLPLLKRLQCSRRGPQGRCHWRAQWCGTWFRRFWWV